MKVVLFCGGLGLRMRGADPVALRRRSEVANPPPAQ
jgi:hypothetical protein